MKKLTKKTVINRLNRKFKRLANGKKHTVEITIPARKIKVRTKVCWEEDMFAGVSTDTIYDAAGKHSDALHDHIANKLTREFTKIEKTYDKPIKDIVAESDFYAELFGETKDGFWNRVMDNNWR